MESCPIEHVMPIVAGKVEFQPMETDLTAGQSPVIALQRRNREINLTGPASIRILQSY